ncbi:HNH endonuclease [Pseudomonas sp. PDM03]|uniref:HNH endonuclease n=1 Tax=Pseudomonas sp. PDM03 TaxID=2769266 RepID=UPI001783BB42|nr:HNH endonuclease [Pseudomonas sp. PDM03]MBD9591185.1 HNH endonuclease [Pseudomonas sp. PDM03]
MASNWNIPAWLEKEVRAKDTKCVYRGTDFLSPKESAKLSPSCEHIINDASIITIETIALCCRGCNVSKGQKSVSAWLGSKYCQERGITKATVAPIIQQAFSMGQ